MGLSLRARAWTALLLPPLAWFGFEQGMSAVLHAHCGQSWIGLPWGVASLAACAVAGRLAWPLVRHRGALANPWLGRLALAASGIFALAILFQTLAILIVPACVG